MFVRRTAQTRRYDSPMDALDNPIWRALTTRQSHLGAHHPPASRFLPEVSVLGGFAAPDWTALKSLVGAGERVGIFIFGDDAGAMPGFTVEYSAPLLQMLYRGRAVDEEPAHEMIRLGADDNEEMMALAALTKPGPFNRRTREMGDFFGVRVGGALVAMAGQRLRVPGHIEVSAICTHPDHVGRGYAASLTRLQIRRILDAGEQPFLHVRGDNTRAIALYERLGFAPTRRGFYFVLRAA
jgi:ribosomal protein S18 acetylase RimI-like enzyme